MPSYRRPKPEPGVYPGPESSGLTLHPRLRHNDRVGRDWLISCVRAQINPRRMVFAMSGPDSGLRKFEAQQDYGSSMVEITEIDTYYQPIYFDVEAEPEIARFILKAFDIQWQAGPLGVTPRTVA